MSAQHVLRMSAILSSWGCCCFGNYVKFSHHPFRKSWMLSQLICCRWFGHRRIYSSDNPYELHPAHTGATQFSLSKSSLAQTSVVVLGPCSIDSVVCISFLSKSCERFRRAARRPYNRFRWYATFENKKTRGNVSKISVNHTCYRQIGSKSSNHSH